MQKIKAFLWFEDRYGVSWPIVPEAISELIYDPRATKAMMTMDKLDIEALRRAAR
jgi:predicted 3-demethylubiquinone-9 3-methyltransferase (glyoxalase superfamily)